MRVHRSPAHEVTLLRRGRPRGILWNNIGHWATWLVALYTMKILHTYTTRYQVYTCEYTVARPMRLHCSDEVYHGVSYGTKSAIGPPGSWHYILWKSCIHILPGISYVRVHRSPAHEITLLRWGIPRGILWNKVGHWATWLVALYTTAKGESNSVTCRYYYFWYRKNADVFSWFSVSSMYPHVDLVVLFSRSAEKK